MDGDGLREDGLSPPGRGWGGFPLLGGAGVGFPSWEGLGWVLPSWELGWVLLGGFRGWVFAVLTARRPTPPFGHPSRSGILVGVHVQ